ncbi:MAG: M48 family metallopeptidase [Desulfobacterales bacterium]
MGPKATSAAAGDVVRPPRRRRESRLLLRQQQTAGQPAAARITAAGARIRRHFRPGRKTALPVHRKRWRILAFALPAGTIIFTDEMVRIAENDDELLSVFAHEIGHVAHRHAMRRVVQDALLSFAVLSVTGDASGVSELFLGLPVLLTEYAYSRGFEREADRFALGYLVENQIPPVHFADILVRIERTDASRPAASGHEKWSNYISTHPPTEARIKAFKAASP